VTTKDRIGWILLGGAVIALVFAVLYPSVGGFPSLGGFGGPVGGSPQVAVPAGASYTFNASDQPITSTFYIGQAGTLEGSYRSAPESVYVYVCFQNGCGLNDSTSDGLIYLGGVGQSGSLHVPLTSPGWYGVSVQLTGCSGCVGAFTFTWVTALEIVP